MAIRPGMTVLFARLRKMINDPAGDNQVFDDQELQDILDGRRTDLALHPLESVPSYPDGVLTYLEFASPWSDWDDNATLLDSSQDALSPETSDLIAGRWTFATEPSYPVYVTGRTYDLNGAAADALDEIAATKMHLYTFGPGRGSYTRSQMYQQTVDLADRYRRRARPQTARLVRSDVNPALEYGAVPEHWRR